MKLLSWFKSRNHTASKYNSKDSERITEAHGIELASFWRRAAALMIDVVLAAELFSIISSLFEPLLIQQGWIQNADDILFDPANFNWYTTAWLIIYFGLTTFYGHGKTPGKAIFRIRIASLVQRKMSFWHSFERALGYGASLLECGFGFLQYSIHPNKRTVHDRVAETIVVREQRKGIKSLFR